MLKRLGYRANLATNGIEALQALERQPYDIVLSEQYQSKIVFYILI